MGQAPAITRRAAAEAGVTIYRSSVPCRVCGCDARYTSSGSCVDCAKKRAAKNIKELRATLRRNRKG